MSNAVKSNSTYGIGSVHIRSKEAASKLARTIGSTAQDRQQYAEIFINEVNERSNALIERRLGRSIQDIIANK